MAVLMVFVGFIERLGLGAAPPVADAAPIAATGPEPPATREDPARGLDSPDLRPGP